MKFSASWAGYESSNYLGGNDGDVNGIFSSFNKLILWQHVEGKS